MEDSMDHIFISYAHQDANSVAELLYARLVGCGFSVWKDDHSLAPGAAFVREISKAVSEREYFLVLLSAEALKSDWVQKEIDMAIVANRKVIPVLLQDLVLPAHLATLQYLQMKDGVNDWLALHKLVDCLSSGKDIPRVYNMTGHKDLPVQNALLIGTAEFGFVDLSDPVAICSTAEKLAQDSLPFLKQAGAGIIPHGHPALASAILAYLSGALNEMPKLFPTFRVGGGPFRVDGKRWVSLQDIRDAGFVFRSRQT
jgi:hypothetical protein